MKTLKDKELNHTHMIDTKIFYSEDVKQAVLEDIEDFENLSKTILNQLTLQNNINQSFYCDIKNLLDTHRKIKIKFRFGDFKK